MTASFLSGGATFLSVSKSHHIRRGLDGPASRASLGLLDSATGQMRIIPGNRCFGTAQRRGYGEHSENLIQEFDTHDIIL
jgi:hypothetical protein